MDKQNEFQRFDATMRDLIKVSHNEIKAELVAEKAAKSPKRKAKTKPSASDRDDDKTD
jgi:hypothetical protein